MDENNNNLGNENNSSSNQGPSVYGDPATESPSSRQEPEVTESPLSQPTPPPTESTSHVEVFGGSVESAQTNNYYTNTNYSPEEPEEFSKGFATASLVMGILSIVTCCCTILSLIFAILGIVFFCIQQKDSLGNKPTTATVGLILSIIGAVIALISVIYSIFMIATGSSPAYSDFINSLN